MGFYYFDQKDYVLELFIERINELITPKEQKPEWEDEFVLKHEFDYNVVCKFKDAVKTLKQAQIYIHRIDWLLRENDTQSQFLKKLKRELSEIENPE